MTRSWAGIISLILLFSCSPDPLETKAKAKKPLVAPSSQDLIAGPAGDPSSLETPATPAAVTSKPPVRSSSPSPKQSPTASPACGTTPPQADAPSGMKVSLEVSDLSVSRADELTLTLRVKNESLTPVSNTRSNGAEYDFWITDSKGNVVWDWANGRRFVQVVSSERFMPGEEKVRSAQWSQTMCSPAPGAVSSGRYTVQALWMTWNESDGVRGWYSNPVLIEIR